jgi:hypothetical protein
MLKAIEVKTVNANGVVRYYILTPGDFITSIVETRLAIDDQVIHSYEKTVVFEFVGFTET